jgi:hypothetical protein
LYCKKKNWGYLMCGFLQLCSFVYIGVMSSYYGFTPSFYGGWTDERQSALIWFKPQSWFGSYLIGAVMGFIYKEHVEKNKENNNNSIELGLKSEENERKIQSYSDIFEELCVSCVNNTYIRRIGYTFGIVLILYSALGMHPLDENGQDYWSQDSKSFFLTVQNFMFTIGFSFLFFPLLFGHLKWLKILMSMDIMIILAKISYAAYLVHQLIIDIFVFSRDQRVIITDSEVFYFGISAIALTGFFAFLLAMMIEQPLMVLEKKFIRN